jgi:lipopolysaccharide/colanic/teichoic acid biosynthesis glycosyltransferase
MENNLVSAVKEETMTIGRIRAAVPSEPKVREASTSFFGPKVREVSARIVLPEEAFVSMLYLERRRAERAQKRYALLLLDVKDALHGTQKLRTTEKITQTLCEITRETDIIGWYLQDQVLGIICTEIGKAEAHDIRVRLTEKFREAFERILGLEKAARVTLSFHFFPEEKESGNSDNDDSASISLYPDLHRKAPSRKLALGVKRAIDIIGSAAALLFLAPVFLIIAILVRATSKGPVFFRQERLGQFGKKFTFLKFRSMRNDCDSKIHEEYVTKFIAGQVAGKTQNGEKVTFKIQRDPRLTPVGAFLRKTSLDELPQFWNALIGEMSLVGPRPPLEYEFKAYDVWHRRRVLEIKPGITGLWQVEGRSRTQFDDMVRLDLKYARVWSIWLDVKILVRTPGAVVSADGAH